jgi:amidase
MIPIDPFNALSLRLAPLPVGVGPLQEKTFVVKENIDVAGHVSTNGHPLWATTHAPARHNAAVVDRLLTAGAQLVGKAQMDEMAYSLLGANPHSGTPTNPAAPDRHPGGSSSGSAVATAAGLVDFAIGTDTAGSCRAPAAFCGVFGFRSSHGAIPMTGVIPLAPSFDVIGWFARDIETMIDVGETLLPPDADDASVKEATLLADGFDVAEPDFIDAAAPMLTRIKNGRWREARLGDAFLAETLTHFRNLQAAEAWTSVGDWITTEKPVFGAGVAQRFEIASQVTHEQKQAAQNFSKDIRVRLDALLDKNGVIVLPTTPFRAPRLDDSEDQLDVKRYQMMRLFILASYCGLPQISLPIRTSGAPFGLSLMGRRGSDRSLLAFAKEFLKNETAAR